MDWNDRGTLKKERERMNPNDILGDVACIAGIPVGYIVGKRKTAGIVVARTLAFAAIKSAFPFWSRIEIARFLGREDGSTTAYALKRFDDYFQTMPEFKRMADELGITRT